jgi:carboxyl-terminal processing protease
MKKTLLLALVFTSILFSCKKKDTPTPPATTATENDLVADSAFLYSKEVYFWNTIIPDYSTFKPRQYETSGDEVSSANNVLGAIAKLQPLDRFSFATTIEESTGIQTGQSLDWGFFVKPAYINSTDIKWYITYTYSLSDAGQKGVKRGWILNKINGTSIAYDNTSIDLLNNLFFGTTTSSTIEFLKPDNTTVSITVNKTDFQANSVLYSNIITTSGGKKVGYLVFNQFFGQPSRNELGTAFSNFQSQGITELIVDLRNNRGGSTDTQDTLANLIAPSSANTVNNGKMYTYQFNQQLQQNNFPLLKKKFGWGNGSFTEANNTIYFDKKGGLTNLSRVFIIGTSSTASASELLINNLKPVMNVQLIGDTTYGKPVGFFPIDLFNKVSIYPISFRTINGAGSADYYSGFAPNKIAYDGLLDWGNTTDPCLGAALYYIDNNKYSIATNTLPRSLISNSSLKPMQYKLEDRKFAGMFVEHK